MNKALRKLFCETSLQVKKASSGLPQTFTHVNPNLATLSERDIKEIEKTGASYVFPEQMTPHLIDSGISHEFISESKETKITGQKSGLFYTYLKNSTLLFEYNEIIRDFFQSIARDDFHYLNLVCEAYLAQHITNQLEVIRKKGFFIELESIRNKQDIELVDWKFYKNLRINRFKNYEKGGDIVLKNYTNKFTVAKIGKEDTSYFENNKPFILATTLKVTTPMKLSIFNQNLSLKLYGKPENDNVSYLFNMETELGFRDLIGFLPNPNRTSKLRQSRITDINKVLGGNPFKNEEIKKKYESRV